MGRDWSSHPVDALRAVDWRRRVADVLVGPRTHRQVALSVALPLSLVAVTAVGDPVGLFGQAGGGVVIISPYAFVVALTVTALVGYAERGFAVAVLAAYGSWHGSYLHHVLRAGPDGIASNVSLGGMATLYYLLLAGVISFWPFVLGLSVRTLVGYARERSLGSIDGRSDG